MGERDLHTDDGLDEHFDEELDPTSMRVGEMIDFLQEARFPEYSDAIAKIVVRAELRYGLGPRTPEVAAAILKELGGSVELDSLQGLDFDGLDQLRVDFVCDQPDHSAQVAAVGEWAAQAEDFGDKLLDLDPSELSKRYHIALAAYDAEMAIADAEMDIISFFNEPAAAADFAFWGTMSVWTAEEAAALTFDKNPEMVNLAALHTYRIAASHSPFVREFSRRVQVIERAIMSGALDEKIDPRKFAKWAYANALSLGTAFVAWTSSVQGSTPSEREDSEGKWNDPRTKATIYKLLVGMAVSKYDLDPSYSPTQGSKAFAAISRDLSQWGIDISDKTIRGHVQAAFETFEHMPVPFRVKKKTHR